MTNPSEKTENNATLSHIFTVTHMTLYRAFYLFFEVKRRKFDIVFYPFGSSFYP
jgi:hypothetical protein